jgi:hypothetical protein
MLLAMQQASVAEEETMHYLPIVLRKIRESGGGKWTNLFLQVSVINYIDYLKEIDTPEIGNAIQKNESSLKYRIEKRGNESYSGSDPSMMTSR